jgi:hypothetical protein
MLFEEYLRDIPLLHIWQGGKIVTAGGFTPADLQTLYNFLRERLPAPSRAFRNGRWQHYYHYAFSSTGASNQYCARGVALRADPRILPQE